MKKNNLIINIFIFNTIPFFYKQIIFNKLYNKYIYLTFFISLVSFLKEIIYNLNQK